MGSAGSKSVSPDRVGAYGYNECADVCGGACNCCTCGTPAWYTSAGCCCCGGDGARFAPDEPAWGGKGAALRKQFEARLRAPALLEIQRSAPKKCGCCSSIGNQGPAINERWCGAVNKDLLHPAGYTVEAKTWVTRGGKGEPIEHLCLEIRKGVHSSAGGGAVAAAAAADTTNSTYVAADGEAGAAK